MRILQLFNWRIADILSSNVLSEIKKQGFDAIQINPLQPLKENGYENWWLSYQPCDFEIGNQYGTKQEIKTLCEVASSYGIDVFPDIIVTHMAEKEKWIPHDKVNPIYKDNPYMWREKKNINNWENRYEITHYCPGNLPALNLQNHDLQDSIIRFLNQYIECGVKGFRLDSAKSIGLPEEGCDFFTRVIQGLTKQDLFIYGEVIFASDDLVRLYSNYLKVLTGSWPNTNPEDVVIFAESHDSYLDNHMCYTRKLTAREVANEYDVITGRYPHTLFYARPYNNEWNDFVVKNAHERNKCKRYTY